MAITAFQAQHAQQASETQRNKRVRGYVSDFCSKHSLRYVNQIAVEAMDAYALWRYKTNLTWIKEIETLRQFFAFCIDREWTSKNPAKALTRPRLLEANNVVPFTSRRLCAASQLAIKSAGPFTSGCERGPWCFSCARQDFESATS